MYQKPHQSRSKVSLQKNGGEICRRANNYSPHSVHIQRGLLQCTFKPPSQWAGHATYSTSSTFLPGGFWFQSRSTVIHQSGNTIFTVYCKLKKKKFNKKYFIVTIVRFQHISLPFTYRTFFVSIFTSLIVSNQKRPPLQYQACEDGVFSSASIWNNRCSQHVQ